MSLINQMLQDLDKRGSDAVAAAPMHAHIHAIPSVSRRRWWLLPALLIVLGGVLASVLWARHRASVTTPVLVAQVGQPVPLMPVTLPAAISDAASVVAREDASLNLPLISDFPVLLKLSSSLEKNNIPVSVGLEKSGETMPLPVIAKVEKTVPDIAENAGKVEKNKVLPPVAAAKVAEPASAVSKFVKETTAQQRAESEYRQATVLQQQGRSNDAVLMLEQALKSDPQHAAARQLLIALLLESKRHEDAARWLQQGLSQDLNQPGLAIILARLQVEKGNVSLAIETLQRSLPHASERADYLAFLAALQQREGRHKEAADLYQRALKKNPQNALWWMGLGISLQADGRNAEALDAYNRAKSSPGLSADLVAFVEQKITHLQR